MASGMLSPRLKIAQKSTPSANAAGGIHLGRSGPNLGALRSLSKGLFGSNRFVPKEQRLLKQAEVFAVSNITSAPVKKEPEVGFLKHPVVPVENTDLWGTIL